MQIKLRLRRPNRDWDFFPYDQILDTMLHELCHNEHGPHNANFYKLWDELRKVCHVMVFICKFDGNKNNIIINKSFYLLPKLVISSLMRVSMLVPMIMFYVSSIFLGLKIAKADFAICLRCSFDSNKSKLLVGFSRSGLLKRFTFNSM